MRTTEQLTESAMGELLARVARRFYADDLKHERYSYAVTQITRIVEIEEGRTVTDKEKDEAVRILKLRRGQA